MKRKIIPYDSTLKALARKLRGDMTFSEVKLWNHLKSGGMMEYDFDRQRPIGNYIVDFYCKDLSMVIEIDGITHQEDNVLIKDEIRQKELERLGVNFIRFSALMVAHDMENVLRAIINWIVEYEEKYGVAEHIKLRRNRKA